MGRVYRWCGRIHAGIGSCKGFSQLVDGLYQSHQRNAETVTGRDEGFTLIETLIAFVVLSMGLLIATQTIAVATKSLARAREDRLFARAMDNLDEQLITVGPDNLPRQGSLGDLRWQLQTVPVSEEVRGPHFTIIQIKGASGRTARFLRFAGGMP
ncbi:MAG: prepilin-type N-terminal cleavage/methylation domain-containing protein [Alphaproteobacteria bacterium]|nr:MAG: prepilin-type N-terminal cleavage/methylation domain-containing protein [Alphaproteobacteria bacterium]